MTAPGRAPSSLPAVVTFGAQAWVPPPYRCSGGRLWAFGLRGDSTALGALCDRVFSQVSDGAVAYAPIGSRIMVTVGAFAAIESETPPFDGQGSVAERQCGVWIPVRRTAGEGPELAVFTPFMWVDNPLSLVAGRETLGFPKSWGWPLLPDDGVECGLDVYGGDFARSEPRSRRPLLRTAAIASAGAAASATPTMETIDAVVATLTADASADRRAALDGFATASIPQVFLKQIPATGASGAVVQQICTATIDIANIAAELLPHAYTVDVDELDSDPFASVLQDPSQTAWTALHITDLEIVLQPGRVLWDARPQPSARSSAAAAARTSSEASPSVTRA